MVKIILTLDESIRPFDNILSDNDGYTLKTWDDVKNNEGLKAEIKAVITNGGFGVPAEIINALPKLAIITVYGVGTDKIDFDLVAKRGIHVTTTLGMPTNDVADEACAMLFSLRRHLVFNKQWILDNKWSSQGEPPLSTSLDGAKAAVIGYGAIGHAIATRLAAFNMEVRFYNRSKKESQFKQMDSLKETMKWADNVFLAVPGIPANHNLINKEMLELLGDRGILINIARGSVVDEEALIAALKNKTICAAGLDVFLGEPNINKGFLNLPNCLIQPHQGSATWGTRSKMAKNIRGNLDCFFSNKPLLSCITK